MNDRGYKRRWDDPELRRENAASRQSRSKALLAAWDAEIDKLREMAAECRMTQNFQRAVFLEGKACGYAKCYQELDAANKALTNTEPNAKR